MRTALFDLPGVDESVWNELSIWNRSFSKRIRTSSVNIVEGKDDYRFRYIMQKDKKISPVAIIYPSIGEGIMSSHSVLLAKIFYDEGYSVVIQGSHFQWEFVKSMPDGYKPGLPSKDAENLRLVTTKILDKLSEKYGCEFKDKVFIGTSFGALTALFLGDKEYKNNTLISKYCSLNQELDDMDSEFNKGFDSSKSIPFYMFGTFIIVASCIMSGSVYMISKRREIAAFTTQQMNPITQEHIENMGTSIGKAVANAAKEINPEYKSLNCPNCGANIDGNGDIEKCEYCGQTLIKTGRFK